MKALQLTRPDASLPPVLALADVPTPTASTGQSLVRIMASFINPSDLLNTKGGFPSTTFPRIPGRDFAGIIESSPSGTFSPGDRVFGTSGNTISFTTDGAHAEYLLAPDAALAKTPEGLSDIEASTVGTPFSTAFLGLQRAAVKPGETVMVLGSTGSVGSAAMQIAKGLGARVIPAARRESSADGVDLLTEPNLQKALELTGGKGVDVVFNTVGSVELMQAALGVLAPFGRLSYISAPRDGKAQLAIDLLGVYRKQLSILGNNSVLMTPEQAGESLRQMAPMFAEEKLKAADASKLEKVKLDGAVGAYEEMGNGSKTKFVIVNES